MRNSSHMLVGPLTRSNDSCPSENEAVKSIHVVILQVHRSIIEEMRLILISDVK
jgi:hypothetical protein